MLPKSLLLVFLNDSNKNLFGILYFPSPTSFGFLNLLIKSLAVFKGISIKNLFESCLLFSSSNFVFIPSKYCTYNSSLLDLSYSIYFKSRLIKSFIKSGFLVIFAFLVITICIATLFLFILFN